MEEGWRSLNFSQWDAAGWNDGWMAKNYVFVRLRQIEVAGSRQLNI